VVKAAVQSGKEVTAVLLEQRAEAVLIAVARSGKEVMAVLLKQGGAKVKITEKVVKAAAAVIFLDWSGVDLSSNPLHLASKLFDSRSSIEL